MAPNLQDSPVEVVEQIVGSLSLEDTRNLRLTCRNLASKGSQGCFKAYFTSKHVDLTESSLRSFAGCTQPGSLGCLVEDLTIVGIVNNTKGLEAMLRKKTRRETERKGVFFMSTEKKCTPEELLKAEEDLNILRRRQVAHDVMTAAGLAIELLSTAFRNLAANGRTGKLRSLSLEVAVYRADAQEKLSPGAGGSWKLIWACCRSTHQTVLQSLQVSELSLDKLDLFSSQRRCSLACNDVQLPEQYTVGLDRALSNIKTVCMSISGRIIDETSRDLQITGDPDDNIDWSSKSEEVDMETLRALATDEANFSGVASLLSGAPNLEKLELHWYRILGHKIHVSDRQEFRLFSRITETVALTKLQSCNLRGVYLTEESLLALLQRSVLKRLHLEETQMMAGTWQAVFDYCTSAASGMEYLHFDDLWEERLLYFDEPGEAKFSSHGGSHGTNTLTRERGEVRKPITYHFTLGPPVGSPQAYVWREQRQREYGPP